MCTNFKLVRNKYTSQSFYVPCGHCPACQQQKANARKNRIRRHRPFGYKCYFVTLTYHNFCVPYVKDVDCTPDGLRQVKVYRDCVVTRRTSDGTPEYIFDTVVLDNVNFYNAQTDINLAQIPFLKGAHGKRGVIFYSDLQGFFARLRLNLSRKYKLLDKISYFACAEYGPTTFRPHFHLLLYVPASYSDVIYSAIHEAWPFVYHHASGIDIQEAIDPAKYVASYVNRGVDFPKVLSDFWPPKCSYSKHFGFDLDSFRLSEILRRTHARSLTFSQQVYQGNEPRLINIPYPKYVINRFFPYFEGCSRLTSASLRFVLTCPSEFARYRYSLGFDDDVVHKVIVRLEHSFERFCSELGLDSSLYGSRLQYADAYIAVSREVIHQRFRIFYDDSSELTTYERYDNIAVLTRHPSFSPSLLSFIDGMDLSYLHPNNFPHNLDVTRFFEKEFSENMKKKKVNDLLFNEIQQV